MYSFEKKHKERMFLWFLLAELLWLLLCWVWRLLRKLYHQLKGVQDER